MTKANRSRVLRRRTRRRGTNRRGGGGAAASASRRSGRRSDRPPTHCDWRVTSSSVDRDGDDIEDEHVNNHRLHPHPTVEFNHIVGKNGHIRNRHLRHALRQTCNHHMMDMTVQRDIPGVTHVRRWRRILSFYNDGECVGSVTVAPIGRVPEWMRPNPRRSPGGTEFPRWVTRDQSFSQVDADDYENDNNGLPPPPVDLGEIVGKNGEITQPSLRDMLHNTGNQSVTDRVPVQGITNVTHVSRYNRLLSFYNNDTRLGSISVQAMGQKQPSWMIMPRR